MDEPRQSKDSASRITRLLADIDAGRDDATNALFPLVYAELKAMARHRLAREQPGNTLTPTALVHDAYLRLLGEARPPWQNRRHFFAAAAEAMRRILIESARRKASERHGAGRRRQGVTDLPDLAGRPPAELLDLDRALAALETQDEAMANTVKLRYFGGLTVEETAQALSTSPRTVNRQWRAARAWLIREMQRGPA